MAEKPTKAAVFKGILKCVRQMSSFKVTIFEET
jgi:hypothetical protein